MFKSKSVLVSTFVVLELRSQSVFRGINWCHRRSLYLTGFNQFHSSQEQFRSWVSQTNAETNTNTTEHADSTEEKPVSLMGAGFEKKIRYTRRQMKNQHEMQVLKQWDNILPTYVKHLYETNPEEARRQFPALIEEFEFKSREITENKPPSFDYDESATFQYPFQQFHYNAKTQRNKDDSLKEAREVPEYVKHQEESLKDYFETLDSHPKVDFKEDIEEFKDALWRANYGTPDPSIPPSQIPCGGCGALLHCTDPTLPGYLPSEIFKTLDVPKLRKSECQRCMYFQHFNAALNVRVSQEDYPKMMSMIRDKKALAVLLVDLVDMPCSIWPEIAELLGSKKPYLVVGNKVDLLPCDDKGYFNGVLQCMEESLKQIGLIRGKNVRDICLVSAKTGYGIEDLITRLHEIWGMKGDIYLIGCTNVGKSTLFNTLLQSDLCKVKAVDLVHRATTSVWPGTTLNLLKFPIMRPDGWRQYLRFKRLKLTQAEEKQEIQLRRTLYKETRNPTYATLIGRIEMTFEEDLKEFKRNKDINQVFNSDKEEFRHGAFCYDTPGAIYKDQILDLLTIEELLKVIPQEIIIPRTFLMRKDQTMFVAGLARIDLLEVPTANHIYVTLFAARSIPVHVVNTSQADVFHKQNLGTELMGVPLGPPERLKDLPRLEGREFTFQGTGWKESCADITLSSLGWVSFTFNYGQTCKLIAYTPEKRGLHLRQPSMLPYAVLLRGKRIQGTPAYENQKCSIVL